MKKNKGFTLAEMLIVVAIIAILIAILIPTFTKQLERAKEAADMANIRSAMSEVTTNWLADGEADNMDVVLTQADPSTWVSNNNSNSIVVGGITVSGLAKTTLKVKVTIDKLGNIAVVKY